MFNEKDCRVVEKHLGLKQDSLKLDTLKEFLKDAHSRSVRLWHHTGQNGSAKETNFYDLPHYFGAGYDWENTKEKQALQDKYFGSHIEVDTSKGDYSNPAFAREYKAVSFENSIDGDYNKDLIEMQYKGIQKDAEANFNEDLALYEKYMSADTIKSIDKKKKAQLDKSNQSGNGEWDENKHPRDDDGKFKAK